MQLSHYAGITLPITSESRRIAETFATQCPIREKADQIQRNTLAVCAVNAYLQLMDIPTDVGNSDSWQPMMQLIADVADLQLPGIGALSCRAMLPGDKACYVPPEDWGNRIGYVAVILDDAKAQATLAGFAPAVSEQTANGQMAVPLSQFSPLEDLIDAVHALQTNAQTNTQAATATESVAANRFARAQSAVTQLNQWAEAQLDELAQTGWQAVEQLLNPSEMSFDFRSVGTIEPPAIDISRAKLVNLGIQLNQSVRVALVLHLAQTSANEQNAAPQTHITLQVHPTNESDYLPEGLLLSVVDDEAGIVASATSRAIDNYVQLQLSGQSEEQFSVQIVLGQARYEERFAI